MSNKETNNSPASKEAVLRVARHDFAQFYRAATADDAAAMDSLVLAHAALVARMNGSPGVPEGTGDKDDALFADLRERVRVCPTFAGLIAAERMEIERVMFEVRPAQGDGGVSGEGGR